MHIAQWPLPQRRDFIRQLRASGSATYHHQLIFQSRLQTFPVYTVDVGFPCYRLANGRTQSVQRELIAEQNLPPDFFTADPDSEAALQQQDAILRRLVLEGRGKELLDILKRDPQTQPLILDNDGYIINGNRRLAAMRMLLADDEATYARFRSVQVVVLPPSSDSDIAELEARLQIAPEGRVDYTWVDEAMMFRRGREQGWSDEHIATIFDKTPAAIREAIAMLDDAEQYLASRGKANHYSLVVNKDYAFQQLQKCRKKLEADEPKKQLFTEVSYLMLDDPASTGNRLYESIPDAFKFLGTVETSLHEQLAPEGEVPQPRVMDGLALLGDPLTDQSTCAAVLEHIRSDENQTRAREIIRDTIEEMRARERERRDAQYCLKSIQKAYTSLQSALAAIDESAEVEGIPALLENIERTVESLREWLDGHAAH